MMTTSTAWFAAAISRSRRLLGCWSRIIGLLTAVVAFGLLQACSAIRLAYNNAPELIYWRIDGYADLTDTQSVKVREELSKLQRWHRGAELPKIAELLRTTQQLASADATPEQVCNLFAQMRRRLDAALAYAEPATISLLFSFSESQIAHIETKMVKSNVEWRDEWAAGNLVERREKRLKASVERSEQFYGTLEERQLAVLREAIARSEFDPVPNYAERLRRQQDLLQTLRLLSGAAGNAKPSVAQATAELRAYLERSVNSPNPLYRAYADRVLLDNCKTFAQLHNSTTSEQRGRALRRLADYERDARDLAAAR